MRAEIKFIWSLDVDDLASWRPAPFDFAIPIRLMVGPEGQPGEESFDLTVCTAGWLATSAAADGIYDARHHLVVDRFDWELLQLFLLKRVRACEGVTWSETAAKVARLGYWEFEDYRER